MERVASAERKVALGNMAFRRQRAARCRLFARAIKFVQPDGRPSWQATILAVVAAAAAMTMRQRSRCARCSPATCGPAPACCGVGQVGYADREICKRAAACLWRRGSQGQFQLKRRWLGCSMRRCTGVFPQCAGDRPGQQCAKKELARLSAAVAKYRKRERAMLRVGSHWPAGRPAALMLEEAEQAVFDGGV